MTISPHQLLFEAVNLVFLTPIKLIVKALLIPTSLNLKGSLFLLQQVKEK
jgi:hypothetical protein